MTDETKPLSYTISTDTWDSIEAASLLAVTAQQAVLPRPLTEGVYATLNTDGGIDVVETPGYRQNREHDWTAQHADRPETVHRTVTVVDVASFVHYLSRNTYRAADAPTGTVGDDYLHSSGSLEVWADVDSRKITGILDGIDGWRKHQAILQLKHSREWVEWSSIDGKLLPQVEFAEFIEDHLSTIAEPAGATLLDICQTLQAHTSVVFKQQQILANGQRQFQWEETTEAKAGQRGDLKIPGNLELYVRVFQGGEPIILTARFRFQIREGVLKIGIKLAEPDKAIEDAFGRIAEGVQAALPVTVLHGRG